MAKTEKKTRKNILTTETSKPWVFNNDIFDEALIDNNLGFIYLITNLVNGRRYYGKKLFWFSKTRQVKKKKKKTKVLSDWKDYYSSSDELLFDVEKYGKENFKREILILCKNKAQMTYWESKLQFENDVLLSDVFYNSWIMCRVRKSKALKEGI